MKIGGTAESAQLDEFKGQFLKRVEEKLQTSEVVQPTKSKSTSPTRPAPSDSFDVAASAIVEFLKQKSNGKPVSLELANQLAFKWVANADVAALDNPAEIEKGLQQAYRAMRLETFEDRASNRKFPGDVPAARPITGHADAINTVPPADLVVFGASGDLTKRLLLPSFLGLVADRELPKGSRIVGVAPPATGGPATDDDFRNAMGEAAGSFAKSYVGTEHLKSLQDLMEFQAASFSPEEMAALHERLQKNGNGHQRIYYMALPPKVTPIAIKAMKAGGLLDTVKGQPPPKIILEKPFGEDAESAAKLSELLKEALTDKHSAVPWEDRALLIDHYMGKSAVPKLIDLRFGKPDQENPWNGAFKSMFDSQHVERVVVEALEEVDAGERANFFESTGALKDMFQSHLQQLASLLIMRRPTKDGGFDKSQELALGRFSVLSPEQVRDQTIRGQYTEGNQKGKHVTGYRQAAGVNPESKVETYFGVQTTLDSGDMKGVPVLIASGKALDKKETTLRVEFKSLSMKALTLVKKQAPHLADQITSDTPSTLRVDITTPKISLEIAGEEIVIAAPNSFDKRTAYHRLLDGAIQGKTELFSSVKDATLMWNTTDAILGAWKDQSKGIFEYSAGSNLKSPKSF